MWLLFAGCLMNSDAYYARRAELLDQDGDGHISADYPEEGGDDCDDQDPDVHPGQDEQPYDGIDNDCDPSTLDDDLDGDGYGIDTDCEDGDANINPGMAEVCDGIDNDCDGVDSCLPQGLVDVADAPLSLWLDSQEESGTGAVLSFLDFDGDGLDDLVVSSPFANDMAGRFDVVTGLDGLEWGSHDLDAVATLTVSGAGGPGSLGGPMGQACDVGGDGFADVVITANGYGNGDGTVYVFEGGPTGLTGSVGLDTAQWTLSPQEPGGLFASAITCAKLDEDTSFDFVVGEPQSASSGGLGGAWVFAAPGRDTTGDRDTAAADVFIDVGSTDGGNLGRHVGQVGDLDGDGLSEIAISSSDCSGEHSGCLWLSYDIGQFMGSGTQVTITTDSFAGLLTSTDANDLGTTIRRAGDIDGDGREDLLIAGLDDDYGFYGVWLFTGLSSSSNWSSTTDDATAHWSMIYAGSQLANECDGGQDVDGDGFADIIIGEQGSELGAAYGGAGLLYLGGPDLQGSLTDDDAWASMFSSESGGRAGFSVALAPDATGDGIADMAVGVPGLGTPGGGVALWWGGARQGG